MDGYAIEPNSIYCSRCPSHCYYCISTSSCEVCNFGYYLTTAQKCKPCASQCTTCSNSPTNCTLCNGTSLYYQESCTYCFAFIPFCSSCVMNSSAVVCTSCLRGKYTAGNSCEPCLKNCVYCTNSSVCLQC